MKNNLSLATVGLVTIKKDIINSPDFLAGKTGDSAAADRIVDQVWSAKKKEQLREKLFDNSVFLTMPSTTRTNVIPVQMAKFLSREVGTPWEIGDEIIEANHAIASKHITSNKRLFHSREFEIKDHESIKIITEFDVIIVDDIITTGGSVRAFTEFLRKQKINVCHVVGLMGDRRFEIDQKTEQKLRKLLKEKNIKIEFESINYLTRTEVGGLIRLLNSARTENAIQKITKQLYGIQRFGVVTDIERTPGADRHQSPERKDNGNVQAGERVQTYSSASNPQRCAWEIKFIQDGQSVKKEEVILPTALGKKEEHKQLKAASRQIVATHDLGSVQVKFTRTRKKINIELQKEKGLDRGRK